MVDYLELPSLAKKRQKKKKKTVVTFWAHHSRTFNQKQIVSMDRLVNRAQTGMVVIKRGHGHRFFLTHFTNITILSEPSFKKSYICHCYVIFTHHAWSDITFSSVCDTPVLLLLLESRGECGGVHLSNKWYKQSLIVLISLVKQSNVFLLLLGRCEAWWYSLMHFRVNDSC